MIAIERWDCVDYEAWITLEDNHHPRRKPYAAHLEEGFIGFYQTLEKAKRAARREMFLDKGDRVTWDAAGRSGGRHL